jgi:hypothetical protein
VPTTAFSYEDKYAGMGTFVDDEYTSAPRSADVEEALAFLRALRSDGPWVLTAIVPDGATTTRTFEASDEDGVRKFIASHNATKNIYFTGNPCGRPSKKPTKADMTGAIFLHTDDDPRDDETPEAAKTRIMAGYDACDPPPSIVVDSGNASGCSNPNISFQKTKRSRSASPRSSSATRRWPSRWAPRRARTITCPLRGPQNGAPRHQPGRSHLLPSA